MQDRLLKKAQKKVKQKKEFYTHAIVMAASGAFMVIVSFFATPGANGWVIIPLAAFALSVIIHYLTVFGIAGLNSRFENWEEVELENEYLKLKHLEKRKEEFLDEDRLRLKELEKRYNDDDFV